MAEKTVNISHLSCRNDTSENWTLKNPILKKGEWGLETDTFSMKFGDGVSDWNSLVYAGKKGEDGITPNITFRYDEETGNLYYSIENLHSGDSEVW